MDNYNTNGKHAWLSEIFLTLVHRVSGGSIQKLQNVFNEFKSTQNP